MKRIIALLAVLAVFSMSEAQTDRSKAPEPTKASKILLGDYQTFKLSNGLTVILVENHELPTVSFSLQLALEPVIEGKEAGTASFAGELLRTGTTSRSKSELDEEIDFLGAAISTNQSGIFGSCLKKHEEKVLELMTDILYHPVFPQEEFDKLKKQMLSVLKMNESDPGSIAGVVANVLRYGKDHPYGEPVTEETVGNISLDGVKAYYNKYFKPDIGYLIMIGDLNLTEGKKLADTYFSTWQPGKVEFRACADPAPLTGNLVAFADKAGAVQSVITITNTFRLKPGDPDVLPAMLMNNVLGGGVFSGRLMMNLREDKAYTYGAESSLSSDKLIGNFTASAQVRNIVTDSAITEFLYEIRRMQDELISEEDLRMNKDVMAGEFARSLESPSTLAAFAMNTIRYHLPADYYATYLERLEKITCQDVQNMAKKYLRPDNCIILVVGNKAETADKLSRFAGNGAVAYFDRYGNPLSATPLALAEGVDARTVIEQYLLAIGGRHALKGVRQLTQKATGKAEAMGQVMELSMNTWLVAPDRICQETRMGDMLLSKQVYDGTKAWVSGMGGQQDITGSDLENMKLEARLFTELFFNTPGYQLTLEGIEPLNGRNVYRLKVVNPTGKTQTDFFDVSTGLKVRTVSTMEAQGQTFESIMDYEDYRDVDGIKFPFLIKQSVAGQMIEVRINLIDTKTEIDPSVFSK